MGEACEHFLYDKGYGPTNLTLKQYLAGLFPEGQEPVSEEAFPLVEHTLLPSSIESAPPGPRERRGTTPA